MFIYIYAIPDVANCYNCFLETSPGCFAGPVGETTETARDQLEQPKGPPTPAPQ